MRTRPLILALMVLLLGGGSALGWWVVDGNAAHNAPAPRPMQGPVDVADDPVKPQPPAPTPEPVVLRPDQPEALQPKPDPAPAPQPKPEPAKPMTEKDIVAELDKFKGKQPTEEEMQRIAELMQALAEQMEEESVKPAPAFTFKATIRGTVVDSSGAGVANADVLVSPRVTWMQENEKDVRKMGRRVAWGPGSPMAKTDAAGNFVVNYTYGSAREVKSILFVLTGRDATASTGESVEFSLNPDETKEGVRLEVPGTGAITGRVVDATGAPLAGARVRALSSAPERNGRPVPSTLQGGGHGKWFVADAAGNFRIVGLLAGDYRVTAQHNGFVPVDAGGTATVAAGLDSPLPADLVMKTQTSMRVTLVCEKISPANQGVTANFYDANGKRIRAISGKADANGVVVFANAPVDAVTFDLGGGIFEKTAQMGCVIKADMHNDQGSVTMTMREMPMRGGKSGAVPETDGKLAPGEGLRG